MILSLLFFVSLSFAKDLIGDPFMSRFGEALFPDGRERFDQLNGLHTWSAVSHRGPFYKWQIQSPKDDFKKLLEVYPNDFDYSINLFELDSLGLASGKSQNNFWSYHSFPIYKGGIGQRYLSSTFQNEEVWEKLFSEYKKHPPEELISLYECDILSPSEKYEYLIGNQSFSITEKQWQDGLEAKNRFGIVPTWYGTCHGTAPASIRSQRAEKSITLRSYDNRSDIIFYPSDIKALLAYAWATSGGESAMIGTRCEEIIQSTGRPGPACNDVNPGAFHLAVTNLVGKHGEPIIIDTSESIQIWNRPLLSYRSSYFRPDTRNLTTNLKNAILSKEKFTKDPYSLYRSKSCTSVVGVWMELVFGAGIPASESTLNTAKDDNFLTINYWYDLELDKDGNIIGGEWHEIFHPDFLWVVSPAVKPLTIYDRLIGNDLSTYNGSRPLPRNISEFAIKSSKTNELLFSIIEKMVELSRQ